MLRDFRSLVAPELAARHESLELRTPSLRLSLHRSENVASDYGLVERAMPFVHKMRRPCLTVLLEGQGRFDEQGRRAWLEAGAFVVSDQRRGGTEAYAGKRCSFLALEWDPGPLGEAFTRGFERGVLSPRELRRAAELAALLPGEGAHGATQELLGLLRAAGLPVRQPADSALRFELDGEEKSLQTAMATQLSKLDERPAIEDVVTQLGWQTRQVHRRVAAMAQRYALPWEHWRSLLHYARITHALRLLSAPGATTEIVARRTGFRSPSALCHALAKAGLPSPGALARAARGGVLHAWSTHAELAHAV